MPPAPSPVSALLSGWLGACLRGEVAPDQLLDAMAADEVLHLVVGLAPDPLSLVLAVAELRRRGGTSATLALPVAGDLAGLAGPPSFNLAALEAGEAVLVPGSGIGLVPEEAEDAVTWHALPAAPPRPLDPVEAGQRLRQTLAETADVLERSEVGIWNPDLADALLDVRRGPALALPQSYPPRLRAVADQAATCLGIVGLAGRRESGALTSYDEQARAKVLAPLERAARQALVAACSG